MARGKKTAGVTDAEKNQPKYEAAELGANDLRVMAYLNEKPTDALVGLQEEVEAKLSEVEVEVKGDEHEGVLVKVREGGVVAGSGNLMSIINVVRKARKATPLLKGIAALLRKRMGTVEARRRKRADYDKSQAANEEQLQTKEAAARADALKKKNKLQGVHEAERKKAAEHAAK